MLCFGDQFIRCWLEVLLSQVKAYAFDVYFMMRKC